MVTRLHRLSSARTVVLAAVVVAFPLTAPLAHAGPKANGGAKLDTAVQHWKDHGGKDRERVIVRVTPGQRGPVLHALKAGGFDVKAEHPLIDAITVEVPHGALNGLVRNPHVETISLDAPTAPHATVAPNGQTLRTTLGLAYSWVPKGSGVGIAIVDSGLTGTSVFGNRITAFYDFTADGTARATAPTDPYGHGTHVAGLAAGSGGPSGGLYPGIATSANLIGLRVLDGLGQGYTSNVIAAIEFATIYRAALGIDVINLSLGHAILEPAATDPLVQAVEAASRSGIVVVVSAGNMGRNPATGLAGYGGITSPGNAPSGLSVGAVDTKGTRMRRDDAVTAYSSRGPTWYDGLAKPDVVAPGHALTAVSSAQSKLYTDYPNAHAAARYDANPYLRLNGTSMAAGVVSGVVATMIEAHRNAIWWNSRKLSPNTIKGILQFTATRMTDPATGLEYDRLTQGAGEVNGHGAIELAKVIDAASPLGSCWAVSQPWPYTTVAGQTLPWSQHIVWGDHIVWGSSIYFHDAAWDASSPWGTLDATHIVWGSVDPLHIVWGDVSLWANHIVWGDAYVGTIDGDHIVWGDADHIVWGDVDHIVWGDVDHIVWGDAVIGNNDTDIAGEVFVDDLWFDDGTIWQ